VRHHVFPSLLEVEGLADIVLFIRDFIIHRFMAIVSRNVFILTSDVYGRLFQSTVMPSVLKTSLSLDFYF
jgi:hypothetical protein